MSSRHIRGAYYTPANIVDLIVENTLGRLCDGLDPALIPDLRVLDPACGDGAFLTGAYSYLLKRAGDSCPAHTLLNCIHGADIDRSALDSAADNLREVSGCGQNSDFRLHLTHGDSLLDPVLSENHRRVMEQGGFDVVIGNPPWMSLAGRFGLPAYSGEQIEHLRERYGGNSYMPNVFEYFVRLGLELTRPGGYFSFIVPDRLASNRHFSDLREHLLTRTEVVLLVYGIPFPGVIADTMVFVLHKRDPRPDSVVRICDYGEPESLYVQSEIMRNPVSTFPRPVDPSVRHVVEAMEMGQISLGDVCRSTSGFGGRSGLICKTRMSEDQIPVLRGSRIVRYAVRERHWFDFRPENLTGRTCNRAKLGASPKILIRKTGGSLIAALDDSDAFPEQSLYFLYDNRSELDFRYILGVLNSRPMSIYYRAKCLTNRRTIPHLKKVDLDRIPLPPLDLSVPADRERHDRMVGLVDEMIRLHEPPSPDPAAGGRIAAVQSEIDLLVCDLYGIDSKLTLSTFTSSQR